MGVDKTISVDVTFEGWIKGFREFRKFRGAHVSAEAKLRLPRI